MLTRLLDEHDVKCFLCNDEPATFRFGEYGKGIGPNCIDDIQTIAKEVNPRGEEEGRQEGL